MRQDIRFFRSLYKCLSSLLSIAFPFQASEQGLSGLYGHNGIQCAAGEVFA